MENVIQLLEKSGITEWKIIEETVEAKEWFFITKKLDCSRRKKVGYFYITVYVRQDGFLGEATAKMGTTATEEEILSRLAELKQEAVLVKNPEYPLVSGEMVDVPAVERCNSMDVLKCMNEFEESENLKVNSYEFFDTVTTRTIRNSAGLNVSFSYPSCELELVLNARDDVHEIEIYSDYRFGSVNMSALKASLEADRQQGEARKMAVKNWKITTEDTPVILSGNLAHNVLRYFVTKCDLDMKYRGINKAEVDDVVAPECYSAESVAFLENSSNNKAYDQDGRPVKSMKLIESGKVVNMTGSYVASCYLGKSDTSVANNIVIAPGNVSVDELRTGPYIEIVSMSSLMVHPITGDFMGEIRLGYYFDGEKKISITGGAISGNMAKNTDLEISKETNQNNTMVAPTYVKLHHVRIAS